MLTKKQIRFLLEQLQWKTVWEDTRAKGMRLQETTGGGYSSDKDVAAIQAALSIQLQGARE